MQIIVYFNTKYNDNIRISRDVRKFKTVNLSEKNKKALL